MSALPPLQPVTTWDYLHDNLRNTIPSPDHLAAHANCSTCWNLRFLKSASEGDLEDMQYCLARGADPNSVDKDGGLLMFRSAHHATNSNALHLALLSDNKNEHVVHYLSKHHRSLVDGINGRGETPLFNLAMSSEKISEFSWNCLISAGAAFDHRSSSDCTPLHFLAENWHNVSYLQKAFDYLGNRSQELQKTLAWMPQVLIDLIHSYFTSFTAKDPSFLTAAIIQRNREGVLFLKTKTDLTLKDQSGITLKEKVEKFENEILETKEFLERENTKKLQLCTLL